MASLPQLILASKSAARQNMLRGAGLEFEVFPADIDESNEQTGPKDRAMNLAIAKAQHISAQYPEALVIGSDQTLVCEGQFLEKAASIVEAQQKLQFLKGRTHELTSAVCAVRDGTILFRAQDVARLTMRDFDDSFLQAYCAKAGDALTQCVGAYALEAQGAWLFAEIDGNYHTILGMPLVPLLVFLHSQGYGP